jgi:hypothetical protein
MIGIKEQQIQRYEVNHYQAVRFVGVVSLKEIRSLEVAKILFILVPRGYANELVYKVVLQPNR